MRLRPQPSLRYLLAALHSAARGGLRVSYSESPAKTAGAASVEAQPPNQQQHSEQ
jgi:hypothetical protein